MVIGWWFIEMIKLKIGSHPPTLTCNTIICDGQSFDTNRTLTTILAGEQELGQSVWADVIQKFDSFVLDPIICYCIYFSLFQTRLLCPGLGRGWHHCDRWIWWHWPADQDWAVQCDQWYLDYAGQDARGARCPLLWLLPRWYRGGRGLASITGWSGHLKLCSLVKTIYTTYHIQFMLN